MPISDTEYFRYLPVSDYDKQWGVYVVGVGCTSVPPFSKSYPVSVHPDHYQFHWENGRILQEYQALYILRGDGEFESKTAGKIKVLPGSLMFLFPGEWHRYRPRQAIGWDEYWISFRGQHIDDLVRHAFITRNKPVLRTGIDDTIMHSYLAVLDRVRTEPVGYQQLIAVGVLEILAAALAAVRRKQSNSRAETIVREAKILLEQHATKIIIEPGTSSDLRPTSGRPVSWRQSLNRQLTTSATVNNMNQLAAHFQLSEKHFRRVFKGHTGLSPYQYYLQIRIHRAKEMLLGTTLSIKEIAASLHFETPFHFSAVFKKKTGMSPSRWRSGGIEPARQVPN